MDNEKYIDAEYLLTHGFVEYNKNSGWLPCDIPLMNDDDLHFMESDFNRNMFAVILTRDHETGSLIDYLIYIQEDAGCGFVLLPLRWSDLPIEYFESIYYGIRGEKPKFTEAFQEAKIIKTLSPSQQRPG